MPYLLPLAMLFGFLTMCVTHGPDYGVVMPLVCVGLVGWTVNSALRTPHFGYRSVMRVVAVVFMGLVALALFSVMNVVTYDALGTEVAGAPIALAVVWCALVYGVAAIVEVRGWIIAMSATCAWALVVNPALFALGLTAYTRSGLYYGVPFAHTAFWVASVVLGVGVLRMIVSRRHAMLPIGVVGGPLLFVGYATGACIAAGMWVPAVLGLILTQLGFRAMYYF